MRNNKVDLKLTKDWGGKKKGEIFKGLRRAYARSIQDFEKAGTIIDPKAVKPKENKVEKKVMQRETK